jgi:hypothetical protein
MPGRFHQHGMNLLINLYFRRLRFAFGYLYFHFHFEASNFPVNFVILEQ